MRIVVVHRTPMQCSAVQCLFDVKGCQIGSDDHKDHHLLLPCTMHARRKHSKYPKADHCPLRRACSLLPVSTCIRVVVHTVYYRTNLGWRLEIGLCSALLFVSDSSLPLQ